MKINSFYIAILFVAGFLYILLMRTRTETAFFYGFAENKETEINHNQDVLIEKIFVTPGKSVKKGELLLTVSNQSLPKKIEALKLRKQKVAVNAQLEYTQIQNKISKLEIQKNQDLKVINSKIHLLNEKIKVENSIYNGLESISVNSDELQTIDQLKLQQLEQQLNNISSQYQQEIALHKKMLLDTENPASINQNIIDAEIGQLEKDLAKLSIYALTDGLIGNIMCKEGEYISSFNTLLNFYKVNPTLVKGFVHENILAKVKVGHVLEVVSSSHPTHKVQGKIIGLGSRIVEIPERLRKIADFKTYGREVLIQIPASNNFLQKEKVLLNTTHDNEKYWTSFLNF